MPTLNIISLEKSTSGWLVPINFYNKLPSQFCKWKFFFAATTSPCFVFLAPFRHFFSVFHQTDRQMGEFKTSNDHYIHFQFTSHVNNIIITKYIYIQQTAAKKSRSILTRKPLIKITTVPDLLAADEVFIRKKVSTWKTMNAHHLIMDTLLGNFYFLMSFRWLSSYWIEWKEGQFR